MARSLSPFVIVYDDQGRPLASQCESNGSIPVPPTGVFDYVRPSWRRARELAANSGEDRGVRIAAVVERVSGPQPGFVLAGRSMREVEARIEQIENMAGLTWIGMLGLIHVGTLVYGQLSRRQNAYEGLGTRG